MLAILTFLMHALWSFISSNTTLSEDNTTSNATAEHRQEQPQGAAMEREMSPREDFRDAKLPQESGDKVLEEAVQQLASQSNDNRTCHHERRVNAKEQIFHKEISD